MILAKPIDLSPLLKTPGVITPEDVLQFRREVFRDGLVSRQEADAIFMINEAAREQCSEWHDFFVEALTDFTVHQAEPRGYVSVENGEWLIRQVARDGHVKGSSELEMLVKTVEKASQCPQALGVYVLEQVANKIISGEDELVRGVKLTAGVIGKAEAEMMRRVLYAASSGSGLAISKEEAEVLFDLNDKTVEAENHLAWNDLFVKAIANHLMAASGYQVPSRQEAFAREQWLEDTQIDVAGTLKNSLMSFGKLFSGDGHEGALKSGHQQMQDAWDERNDKFENESAIAEKIDGNEAHWLVDRIGRDGVFHENEKALIRFLKEDSPNIHPALRPLLDKVA